MALCLAPAAGFEIPSAANLEEALASLDSADDPPLGFPNAKELLTSQTSLSTAPPTNAASSLVLLSRLSVITWTASSCMPGDLAMRIDNDLRVVIVEMMERGVKSMMKVAFDMVELLVFEQGEAGGQATDAPASDFATECQGCGERFATDSHRRSHQQSCPLYRSSGVGEKRPLQHFVSIHMAFKEPPSFWREAELDPLLPLQLVPCEDITGGEISRTLQLSVHARDGDQADITTKLADIIDAVRMARQTLADAIEENRYTAVLGAAVMKQFDEYGHFRGVVQGFQKPFFAICYADGDQEEVDARELGDLLVLPADVDGSGSKKRRRRRTLSHVPQKAVTRVGCEYQAVVPEYRTGSGGSPSDGPELRTADLFQQTHAPSSDAPRAAAAVAAIKARFGCTDINRSGEDDAQPRGTLRYPEEQVLEALYRARNDVAAAESDLNAQSQSPVSSEALWTPNSIALFSQLVFQHQKNFVAVSKEMGYSTAEVMEFYYSHYKGTRQYAALKSQLAVLK